PSPRHRLHASHVPNQEITKEPLDSSQLGLVASMTLYAPQAQAAEPANDVFSGLDAAFDTWALDQHVPGLVWGVVSEGKLVHLKALGVQDLDSRRPVTPQTLFRIASMTKAFTALSVLSLRDDGKLQLDALAETYVPELRGWRYPTSDSPRIRVRDLLNHTAGFVTDDPWGDRQTPLPDADFTALLRQGLPFARAPQTAMEYSNLGYALLGRIIDNTSGQPYARRIEQRLLAPLGMKDSGFDVEKAPAARRALGYRWEDGQWRLEPTMGPGAFGAMGGLQTSAEDYARWLAFLLDAWPARDGAETGPVRRATVREMAQGSNFLNLRSVRPGSGGAGGCAQASAYAMGLVAVRDCELGEMLVHGGGYPGYGSFMILMPGRRVGLFALTNRTYAGPSKPLLEAALGLHRAKWWPQPAAVPVSAAVQSVYGVVRRLFQAGRVDGLEASLSMNFLMDRDAAGWARDLAALKAEVGACDLSPEPQPSHAQAAHFEWRCERGRVDGDLLLEPSATPRLQSLELARIKP
ncbi:MAG: beta-lactamase family protein, partial [Burkholderiaceae bacterium]|nr:beta-lactamase family protein [Burkholderiaceae bacterium]